MSLVIALATPTPVPNSVQIRPQQVFWVLCEWVKYNITFYFKKKYILETTLQVRPLSKGGLVDTPI